MKNEKVYFYFTKKTSGVVEQSKLMRWMKVTSEKFNELLKDGSAVVTIGGVQVRIKQSPVY